MNVTRFLPQTWQIQTPTEGVYEHIHLSHSVITAPGDYRIKAQLMAMAIRRTGTDPFPYFTARAAVFIVDPQSGIATLWPKSEVHLVSSIFGKWVVNTVTPEWNITLTEDHVGKELDIRLAHFASGNVTYNPFPSLDWLGLAGGDNENPSLGRTWINVEGPL